jgi:hypothetical protein
MRTLLVFAAVSAGVVAQDKLGPRSFFPPEYQAEFFVDVAAVRAHGFLGALQRSLVSGALRELEKGANVSLDDLDRVRWALLRTPPADGGHEQRQMVFVAEGKALAPESYAPEAPYEFGTFERTTVAGHAVHVWTGSDEWQEAYVAPRPGFAVRGDRALIESILDGSGKGGAAHPDLLALLSARGVLAQLAMARCGRPAEAWFGDVPAPQHWLVPADPLDGYWFRLVEQDGVIELQALARFARDGDGVRRLEAEARAALAAAQKHRRFGAFKKLWNAIELTRDGGDLRARIVMGPPERAAAMLAQTFLPVAAALFTLRAEPELQVMEVNVAPAIEPEPQPEPASRPGERK